MAEEVQDVNWKVYFFSSSDHESCGSQSMGVERTCFDQMFAQQQQQKTIITDNSDKLSHFSQLPQQIHRLTHQHRTFDAQST